MRWSARNRQRLGLVEKVMGAFLILAGILIFTGEMPVIANWLIDVLPALGKIG
jgi:cytochrome c-type biogenesis protein